MPKHKFTDLWVQNVKSTGGKQTIYFDESPKGDSRLMLCVGYAGTKTWRALYYVDGKARSFKLGVYPTMPLARARDEARSFRADPQAYMDARKPKPEPEQGPTFRQVAENFIVRHVREKGLRSEKEIQRCLDRYVYPRWQDRTFTEIDREAVNRLLDELVDNNGKRQADYVLAILSKLMRWQTARDGKYVSPIVPGMKRSSASSSARKRILSDDEIRALWKAAASMRGVGEHAGTFGDLVRILLLTAQRREKVATMKWTDLDDGTWNIPVEEREKNHALSLKLPSMAREIIEARPNDEAYVFGGRVEGRPFNSFSQHKALLDRSMPKDTPQWTLHDLRRTARSLMARAGIRPDIAERTLGHAIGGVAGVYDRHSYADEKAQALEALASLIQRILDPSRPDNVISLTTRAT